MGRDRGTRFSILWIHLHTVAIRIVETIVEAIAFCGDDYNQAPLIVVPQYRHSSSNSPFEPRRAQVAIQALTDRSLANAPRAVPSHAARNAAFGLGEAIGHPSLGPRNSRRYGAALNTARAKYSSAAFCSVGPVDW